MLRNWYMTSTAASPLLCHADDGGTGDGGGSDGGAGGAGDPPPAGDPPKAANLGDKLKGDGGGDGGGGGADPLDGVAPPANGGFDMAQLPEDLRGQTADEALAKVYGELQKRVEGDQAKGTKPARAEDYQLELSDSAKKVFNNIEDDPLVDRLRKWAHKKGMGSGEFQGMFSEILTEFAEAGVIDEPIDIDAEAAKLGDQGPKLYRDAEGYIGRLEAKLDALPAGEQADMKDVIGELKLQLGTAAGVKLINYMAGLKGETGPGAPHDPTAGQITEEKLQAMMRDKRYRTGTRDHDPDYRARVDKLGEQFYGKR